MDQAERVEAWLDAEAAELAGKEAELSAIGLAVWVEGAARRGADAARAERGQAQRAYGEEWRRLLPPRRSRPRGGGRVRVRLDEDAYGFVREEAAFEKESLTVWLSEAIRGRAELDARLREQEAREAPVVVPLDRREAVRRGLEREWDAAFGDQDPG